MRLTRTGLVCTALLASTGLVVPAAPAAVILDTFETAWAVTAPLSTNRFAISGPGILGTQRDFISGTNQAGLNVSGGEATLSLPVIANVIELEYDGVQVHAIAGWPDRARQLPVTDLTEGGLNDALLVTVLEEIGDWTVSPLITSGAIGQFFRNNFALELGDNYIPYSSFISSAGGTPTAANGISLQFRSSGGGQSLRIGALQSTAVPEPATLGLLGAGLLAAGLLRRRRR